ncbi:MAG TPA: HEAT repeat domain-containing protein [Gaiellaceae bacterium]|nr:HEAT repeat domain-containing protein [Gaiellaceae bacterium]
MSRRSEANEEFLRARQHEADQNVPGLIGDLTSEQPLVRAHVARVLARLGAAEAAPHIAKLAADPVENVRMTAYMTLGELRAEGVTQILLGGLDDPVPVVRMGAADGLADLHDPSAIPRLREVLAADRDREVRFCVAQALVKLGDKEVVNDLPNVLRAMPWRMRLSSEWKELNQLVESQGT